MLGGVGAGLLYARQLLVAAGHLPRGAVTFRGCPGEWAAPHHSPWSRMSSEWLWVTPTPLGEEWTSPEKCVWEGTVTAATGTPLRTARAKGVPGLATACAPRFCPGPSGSLGTSGCRFACFLFKQPLCYLKARLSMMMGRLNIAQHLVDS